MTALGCVVKQKPHVQPESPTTLRGRELRQKLEGVSPVDGISKQEAQIIAASYFFKHVGCGSLDGIDDGKDVWIVRGRFGEAADPIKGFSINKKSGSVLSPIGPNYSDPKRILE